MVIVGISAVCMPYFHDVRLSRSRRLIAELILYQAHGASPCCEHECARGHQQVIGVSLPAAVRGNRCAAVSVDNDETPADLVREIVFGGFPRRVVLADPGKDRHLGSYDRIPFVRRFARGQEDKKRCEKLPPPEPPTTRLGGPYTQDGGLP